MIVPPTGPRLTFSSALGSGSNNLGEVWAVGLGLTRAAPLLVGHPAISEVHVFSDSTFAIGVCSRGWFNKVYHSLASSIRRLSRSLPATVFYHKVAAHAGIPLNDLADAAAKRGAMVSKSLAVPRSASDVSTAFAARGFDAFNV